MVRIVVNRRYPRALRLAAWNRPLMASRKPLGHSCSCPGNDALKVVSNHPRYILHGFDL